MTKDDFITYCNKTVQNFIKLENGEYRIFKQWRPVNAWIVESKIIIVNGKKLKYQT
jgi:hypothetical protein